MAAVIFTGSLSGAFQPTRVFLIRDSLAVLDFAIGVATSPATVEWYYEIGETPATFYREVVEENPGAGVVEMVPATRRFSALPSGSTLLNVQTLKSGQFARVQLRVTVGTATAVVSAPFEAGITSPTT